MFRITKIKLGLLIVCIALMIWGFFIEPGLLTQRNLKLNHWLGSPLKVAFFSDLHAGAPHINREYIDRLIDRINAMSPDLILIGGDLVINGVVGGEPIPIESVALQLRKLKAPLGVYAVLGNHDWWNDGPKIQRVLESNGIIVLENKARLVRNGTNSSFWLVGIGDAYTNHANIDQALSEITSDASQILFMHDPSVILQMKSKFFLSLAGHMHGGQIYIPGIGALVTPGKAPKNWAGGWVDFELGSLFVSKGIGTSIIPVRLNATPEFVILELKNFDK